MAPVPILDVTLTAPLELAGYAAKPDTVLICTADAVSGSLDIRSHASMTAATHPQRAERSQHSGRPHMAARTGAAGTHDSRLHKSARQQQRLADALLNHALARQRAAEAAPSALGRAVASVVLSARSGEQPGRYAVHPAALDASTHTAAALAGGRGADRIQGG